MTDVAGKVVVLTGAGAGIGRAVALELARAGADLGLSDIDEVGLNETAGLVTALGARVHAQRLDIADETAVFDYAASVVKHFGAAHVVINNAGITLTGDFEDITLEQMRRVIEVDFWGVVHATKALLPHLIASGAGHIVNVSSLAAYMAAPMQSPYTAAKFAVRGLTESLRQEMLINRHPVHVTCVIPGAVRTDFNRKAEGVGRDSEAIGDQFDRLVARTTPEAAASQILHGIQRNAAQVLIGLDAKAISKLVRLIGPRYQRLLSIAVPRMTPPKQLD